MNRISLFSSVKLGALFFILVFIFAANGMAKSPHKKNYPDNLIYAHLFTLVAALDNVDGSLPDFFRNRMSLSEDQFQVLRTVSRNFADVVRPMAGKSRFMLSLCFRDEIRQLFGEKKFGQFDKLVKEKIITRIVYEASRGQASAAFVPSTGYGSAISLNEFTHILNGTAYTSTFGFSPNAPSDTCSTSATMTGPGVSVSGTDSAGCFERTTGVGLDSPNYRPASHYCINATHMGNSPESSGTSSACLDTPAVPEPVIFIPGIMGSVIKGPYQGDTVQYWPNFNFTSDPASTSARNLTLDTTSLYYRTGLLPTDAVRCTTYVLGNCVGPIYKPLLDNLSTMGFDRPYDVQRHFEQNLGCNLSLKNPDVTQLPNLFVFPYDWRQDLNQTALQLKDYVTCVRQIYPPGTMVNVIAHSMGGLVVRRYILQAQQNNQPHGLDKVITIASPFLGSADATYKLYTGGPLLDSLTIAISPGSIRFLAPYFPSIHQLLPSRKYHQFRLGFLYERGDVDGNGIPNEHFGFDRIVQFLNADFPATSPGTAGTSFHNFAGQDDWRSDQSGIKYFHIIGEQAELLTTDGLYVSLSARCKYSGNRFTGCFRNRRYIPIKGLGDGTVSTLSTAFGWNDNPVFPTSDLAPPGVRIFFRSSLVPNTDYQADHTKMTQDAKVRDLIAYLLGVGQQPALNGELFEVFRPNSLAQNARTATTILNNAPSHYLTIAGQTQIAVSDQMGNTAAVENGFLRNDVPGLHSYEMVADDSVMLTFTTGTAYTAEFQAGTTPIEIELVTRTGNQTPTSAVRYKDLDLPVNTHLRLMISQAGTVELRSDMDNDGTYETLVSPTVNLSGSQSSDVDPPNVGISLTAGQGNTAIASITANDAGSGVSKIWYSFDGQNFDQYSTPVTITLSSNPVTIEAFADDNAANRSGLVSRTMSLTPTILPIAECIESDSNGYKAWFGYQNQTTAAISIPAGVDNLFYPFPGNKGQITSFQPGLASRSFSVRMISKRLDWKLRGNDGLLRTATASFASTPLCQ